MSPVQNQFQILQALIEIDFYNDIIQQLFKSTVKVK